MTRRPVAVAVFLLLAACASAAQQKHLAGKQPPAAPVNINTATADQLTALPGVGPATARAIVAFRKKHGPFRRAEELLIIRGVSRARLNKMRPYIVVK